jgi:hypothetical protein
MAYHHNRGPELQRLFYEPIGVVLSGKGRYFKLSGMGLNHFERLPADGSC